LLTVHPNIIIVFFTNFMHKFFNTFITFFYMFRAILRSSSGGQIVLVQSLVSSLSLGDCSVHRLRKDSFINLCTEQSPKESDDTRGCTNTTCPPEDGIIVLETCRGIKIKNLCIKLVKKTIIRQNLVSAHVPSHFKRSLHTVQSSNRVTSTALINTKLFYFNIACAVLSVKNNS